MRVKDYRKTQRDVNEFCVSYSSILRRRKTRNQWIVRCLLTLCIVVFLTGFFTNLTGLNSKSGVVLADEKPKVSILNLKSEDNSRKEFNPVKKKKVVVVIITDEENAKELLDKLTEAVPSEVRARIGGEDVRKVTE